METYKVSKFDIALDEAGRGPFCGPVCAGAVIWADSPEPIPIIKDSKTLSKKKRKLAYDWIIENVKYFGMGLSTEKEIDQLGIFEATKTAMVRAIDDLFNKNKSFLSENKDSPTNLTIDGIGWDKRDFDTINKFNLNQIIPVVKGDAKYCNIAAASILAKEYHDQEIDRFCISNQDIAEKYDLLNNKGYGTKKHREGIVKYGLSDYHRKSYNINYSK